MRVTLYDAMAEAVDDAARASSIRTKRGKLWTAFKTGRRATGYRIPATVSVTFLARPWMAIHETGGQIVPKSKKYLALPMPDAFRRDGAMKRRSPSGWKQYGTFVYTSKRSGKKFIVYRSKTQGRLVFLFHLADSVDMQKRMNLLGAIEAKEPQVVSLWSGAVRQIFNSIDLYGIAFEGLRIES
jgi:hypothetical protein